jgi:crossover junction endodeoxyribonuclease RuvC
MKIFGIDPGTVVTGYGIIETGDGEPVFLECGVIKPPARSSIGERLSFLYKNLMEIISASSPDVIAIEEPFVAKNARTALAIGRAQAVAILSAANCNIPSFEYTPARIKQRVATYGASSKEQVQEMVRLQLGLEYVPEPNDAADALAVALCHMGEAHVNNLLQQ